MLCSHVVEVFFVCVSLIGLSSTSLQHPSVALKSESTVWKGYGVELCKFSICLGG